jgi:hypothetical protein
MTTIIQRSLRTITLTLLSLAIGGLRAQAQPTLSAPALPDTFVAAVPLRAMEEVNKDNERVSALRSQSKQRLARAQEEVLTLASIITAREKDLDALGSYLDTVNTDKNADEVAKLKQKSALLDKVIDLLKLRKKVREEEVDMATATIAYTEAQEALFTLEGTLDKKRNDRAELARKKASATDLAAMDLTIKSMEGQVLEFWGKALKKHDDAVSEEGDYLKLLIKHSEAQEVFHNP